MESKAVEPIYLKWFEQTNWIYKIYMVKKIRQILVALQHVAQRTRSKIRNVVGLNHRVPRLLMRASPATFHGQIIYAFDSVNNIMSFDSIAGTSGTIDVTNDPIRKDQIILDIDPDVREYGSIGEVVTRPKAQSPDLNYDYIQLKLDTTTGKYVFLRLRTEDGTNPSGSNKWIAHDQFADAFVGKDMSTYTSISTQNLAFSPNIGTITIVTNPKKDKLDKYTRYKIGNPRVH